MSCATRTCICARWRPSAGWWASCGLPPDRDRLRRAIELSSFKALRKQEEEHGFRERSTAQARFFREGKAGGWREKLTRAQVETMVAVNEAPMRRFGYWPVKDWQPASQAAGAQA